MKSIIFIAVLLLIGCKEEKPKQEVLTNDQCRERGGLNIGNMSTGEDGTVYISGFCMMPNGDRIPVETAVIK